MTKFWNAGFLAAMLLFLLLGAVRTLLFPAVLNAYENRTANRVTAPGAQTLADGSFQNGCEAALSDQIPGALMMKKAYNNANAHLWKTCITRLADAIPQRYISCNGVQMMSGSMMRAPAVLRDEQAVLDVHIDDIRKLCDSVPSVEKYLYYIKRDADVNFETGEPSGIYEYLREQLRDSFDAVNCFSVSGLDQFQSDFYRYDHHWNCHGSYQGYTEVLSMLAPTQQPLEPQPLAAQLIGTWSGSRALTSGTKSVYSEDFYAYRFPFPPMTVTADGVVAETYGNQSAYLNGMAENVSYAAFYGADCGELIFDTGNAASENILILGESYDNAILQLLASHFGKTYSVDLRYYSAVTDKDFSCAAYVREHNISKILIIGSSSYFDTDSFLAEK